MRALNKHTAPVAGIAPGSIGEVDPDNSGIKVFVEAGLLVDADTVEPTPKWEPTLDELREQLRAARGEIEAARVDFEKLGRENENLREHVNAANANALKFNREMTEARDRAAELDAQNKQLAAVAETNASELKKAHDASGKLAARVAELEAQLAAKAEGVPTAEPASSPEAPAKKGKG